jgi:YaiO family outer membrane protein
MPTVPSVFRVAALLTAVTLTAPLSRAADVLADARALSSNGHRAEAIQLLEKSLQESPDDPDYRVLYGLMLSWDDRYDEARKQFEKVLDKRPDYSDAIAGLINVEMWSGHPERAEQIASRTIVRKGPSPSLLFVQARALRAQHRDRDALAVLRQLLVIDPVNEAAIEAERSLRESLNEWQVDYTHTYEWFGHKTGAWNENDASFGRSTPIGSVYATFMRADRFGLHSNLSEITFYPHIREGTYGYVGFGYSHDGTLFPFYRIGAEIFQSLPYGMEASVGYRKFGFADWTNMYTGSVGKYLGKWLVTTRFFLTPDQLGSTKSVSVSARRFLHHDGDYVEVRFGTGPSPFDPRSEAELQTLNAVSGYVQLRKALGPHFRWDLLAGLAFEDRLYQVAVEHYVVQSTVSYRF